MTKTKISEAFLKAMPKADLHIHLDGSMRPSTIIDLAKKNKVKLPTYTDDGLKKLVFKDKYASLEEYLKGFQYTCAVLQTPEALERASYELALDCFDDGVYYIEPRFAPQLHINKKMPIEAVLEAVNRGLKRAAGEINGKKSIAHGNEPQFAYGIIGCAVRMFNEHFSDYYREFINIHSYSSAEERYALASLELAKALVEIRDKKGIPIVGFDLVGAEAGFPGEVHWKAYHHAHKNFMRKTVHAGEAYGAASIFQATTDLYADRIGHGTHLFDLDKVDLPTKAERIKYTHDLAKFISDRRITIEICLTSNTQTTPELRDIKKHPCKKMLEEKLSVTFCTDNRLVSNTTSTKEFKLAVDNFSIDLEQLKDIVAYGFKRSFYPGDYKEKRPYVRKVLDYFERLEREYFK